MAVNHKQQNKDAFPNFQSFSENGKVYTDPFGQVSLPNRSYIASHAGISSIQNGADQSLMLYDKPNSISFIIYLLTGTVEYE